MYGLGGSALDLHMLMHSHKSRVKVQSSDDPPVLESEASVV